MAISARFDINREIDRLLSDSPCKEQLKVIVTEYALITQRELVRAILVKLYNSDNETYKDDFNKYVSRALLLGEVPKLTSNERRHILIALSAVFGENLKDVWG